MNRSRTDTSILSRSARLSDAGWIADIYNWYVENTFITFEAQPLSNEIVELRLQKAGANCPWLVAEEAGKVIGFAYAGEFRARAAYRHSLETTIYLDPSCQGKGVGRQLYAALIDELQSTDAHVLIAVIALPNPQSVALHEKLGFVKVGHLAEIGRKFDRWVDTGYWHRKLRAGE